MRWGWPDGLDWFANPFTVLSDAAQNGLSGLGPHANIGIGLTIFLLLIFIIVRDREYLLHQFSGRLLLLGSIIGMVAADATWALLVITLLIYRGTYLLVKFNDSASKENLLSKRGFVITGTLIIATIFMLSNKGYTQYRSMEIVSPTDALIRTVCTEAEDHEKPFKAASQWPARTMIVCRRDVFPLPPAASNGEELLSKMTGITHMLFNHNDEANQGLSNNIADLSGLAQTIALQKGGVVIRFKKNNSSENDKKTRQIPPPPPLDKN